MKKLISVATLSALLAVGAFASITAFAANAPVSGPGIVLSEPQPPTASPLLPEPANEPAETPGTESATEPAGDTGHADDPADANADHEFDGEE